jgi:hypothetical protein
MKLRNRLGKKGGMNFILMLDNIVNSYIIRIMFNFSNIGENYGKENRKNQSSNRQRDWQKNGLVNFRDDLFGKNFERYAHENYGVDIIALCGWIGAIFVMIAPFFNLVIWCVLAIIGLSLLTIQAIKNRVNNLIFLNISSIIILLIRLIKELI